MEPPSLPLYTLGRLPSRIFCLNLTRAELKGHLYSGSLRLSAPRALGGGGGGRGGEQGGSEFGKVIMVLTETYSSSKVTEFR